MVIGRATTTALTAAVQVQPMLFMGYRAVIAGTAVISHFGGGIIQIQVQALGAEITAETQESIGMYLLHCGIRKTALAAITA
jgi:hypothetical protein